jgi:cytochrome P450
LGFQGNGLAAMTEFAEKQVTDRLARWDYTDDKQPDQDDEFLTKVLWKHKENPEVFTMEDVHMTCGQNLVAGSDTTSIALSSTMWYLSKYPEKMAKVRKPTCLPMFPDIVTM